MVPAFLATKVTLPAGADEAAGVTVNSLSSTPTRPGAPPAGFPPPQAPQSKATTITTRREVSASLHAICTRRDTDASLRQEIGNFGPSLRTLELRSTADSRELSWASLFSRLDEESASRAAPHRRRSAYSSSASSA